MPKNPSTRAHTTSIQIRKARSASDWKAIRELCCQTGDAGDPIAPVRWPFFAQQWVGPYQLFARRWAYVAVATETAGAEPQIVGYLTGCAHTQFFKLLRALHSALLVLAIWIRIFPRDGDTQRFVRRAFGYEKSPERKFGAGFDWDLAGVLPAHLHMNVARAFRGSGAGRALLTAFVADLARVASPGVHLYCGDGPLAFYAKEGFEVIKTIEFRPGIKVHAMGLQMQTIKSRTS